MKTIMKQGIFSFEDFMNQFPDLDGYGFEDLLNAANDAATGNNKGVYGNFKMTTRGATYIIEGDCWTDYCLILAKGAIAYFPNWLQNTYVPKEMTTEEYIAHRQAEVDNANEEEIHHECPKCGAKFSSMAISWGFLGCREKEEILCPDCGTIVGYEMTDGIVQVHLIEHGNKK